MGNAHNITSNLANTFCTWQLEELPTNRQQIMTHFPFESLCNLWLNRKQYHGLRSGHYATKLSSSADCGIRRTNTFEKVLVGLFTFNSSGSSYFRWITNKEAELSMHSLQGHEWPLWIFAGSLVASTHALGSGRKTIIFPAPSTRVCAISVCLYWKVDLNFSSTHSSTKFHLQFKVPAFLSFGMKNPGFLMENGDCTFLSKCAGDKFRQKWRPITTGTIFKYIRDPTLSSESKVSNFRYLNYCKR